MMPRLCTALTSLVVASATHGSLVTFTNVGGQFDWLPHYVNSGGPPPPETQLDVTAPPNQTGSASPIGIGWTFVQPATGSNGFPLYASTGASARIAASSTATSVVLGIVMPATNLYAPTDYSGGAIIGPGANWQTRADLGYNYTQAGGINWIAPQVFTMGIELTLGDGVHYGYARFALVPWFNNNKKFEPTEWGYETQPGTPISVPGPAAPALLLSAMSLAIHRRRR